MSMAISAVQELARNLKTTYTSDTSSNPAKTGGQSGGDSVSISAEGLRKSQEMTVKTGTEQSQDSKDTSQSEQLVERLKKEIEKLRKEIEAIESGNLPDAEKREKLQAKRQMLSVMESQLAEAQTEALKQSGFSKYGGTRAQGMSSSLT